jgi:hypothetical protein
MNPNYSRPRTDLDVTRPNRSGQPPSPGYAPPHHVVKSDGVEPADLTEDDLLIYCPTVLGFSFSEKQWGESISCIILQDIRLIQDTAEFAVADIEDIEWSSLPFDSLSISNEQRDVIMALVEARDGPSDPSVTFDDVITGKGKGLNLLLQYGSALLLYVNVLTCEQWRTRTREDLDSRGSRRALEKGPLFGMFYFLAPSYA